MFNNIWYKLFEDDGDIHHAVEYICVISIIINVTWPFFLVQYWVHIYSKKLNHSWNLCVLIQYNLEYIVSLFSLSLKTTMTQEIIPCWL